MRRFCRRASVVRPKRSCFARHGAEEPSSLALTGLPHMRKAGRSLGMHSSKCPRGRVPGPARPSFNDEVCVGRPVDLVAPTSGKSHRATGVPRSWC